MTADSAGRGPAWQDTDPADRPGEQWLPVVGFEGYFEVSDHGRVRSLDRVVVHKNGKRQRVAGRIRKQDLHRRDVERNYPRPRLNLRRDGKKFPRHAHSLVLESFVGPRPKGHEACHNDGDSTNNRADNLRWGTPSENMADMQRHGTYRNLTMERLRAQTQCSRGHAMADGNLVPSALRRGGRKCLACARARDRVRPGRPNHGRDLQEVSDEAYREILSAADTAHAQLLLESEEWVSRRLEQISRGSTPQTDSQAAGDTAEALGDTTERKIA